LKTRIRAALALSALPWVIVYPDGASTANGNSPTVACQEAQAALQILGSSGPLNAEGRASTSYVLWRSGRPAIIVDLGPGSVANLVRAGGKLTELEALLISHLHPDHVSDLPGLLWDEDILGRANALLIVGPAGNADFPDIGSFLDRLFGAKGESAGTACERSDDARRRPERSSQLLAASILFAPCRLLEALPRENRTPG
jgi:hypothetical protein